MHAVRDERTLLLRRWSETERRPYCEEKDISWKSKETDFVETENQCFQTNMMNVAIVIPTWQSSAHLTGRHVSIYFHRVPMLNFSGRDFVRPNDETYKICKFWPPSLAGLTCYQFVRAKRFTKWDYRASLRFSLYERIPRFLDEESKRIFFINIVAEACGRINLPDASRPQSRLCSLFQRCECPFSSIRVIFNARSTNLKRLPRRHFGFAVFPDQFYDFYIAESWKEIGGRRWSCMFYSA